jgi:hypothetical protein
MPRRARVADFRVWGSTKLGPLSHSTRLRAAPGWRGGRSFPRQPRARQFALLADLDRRSYGGTRTVARVCGPWFKPRSWRATTSEIGASKELVFDPVPGSRETFTLTDEFRMPSNLTIAASL